MSKFLLNHFVQISKALVYSKIQFLFKKELSSDFGPSGPAPPVLACFARRVHAQPIRPKQPWRICQKVYFLRLCSFRQRRLQSLTSLPCGPRPSISSPSPCRLISLTSLLLLVASGHPTPPGLQHRDANRSLHSPALIPTFNTPLNPLIKPPRLQWRYGHYRLPFPPSITTLTPALLCSLLSPQLPPHRAPTATTVSLRRLATSPLPEPQ
jgi:hypothetical protein